MKFFSKILLLAAIAGIFFSCQKDDDVTTSSEKEVTISYSFTNTDDFFDLMNVSVEYIDATGALKKESITDDWTYNKTVPYSSAPADYKCVVTYSSAYTELEQPKEKYTIQADFSAKAFVVMSNGETKSLGNTIIKDNAPKTWTAETINNYLALHVKELSYEFEASLEK